MYFPVRLFRVSGFRPLASDYTAVGLNFLEEDVTLDTPMTPRILARPRILHVDAIATLMQCGWVNPRPAGVPDHSD